ncbi:TspO/MBR family protein [Flavobacterium subsaxonicum]|uniref:CrtK n=1 Tax=Flavobacterium subsaxonicum WB 4.1-42 = DSM 21790 TaxID=1121898 RepID=A0A0A2MGR0_9FLAO|nr:TspO/MBR family protein [Flavobacterium subsaxonicum]KGO91479.1 CrtK [Flavobacterium subsaxonicum WB 4.1-42 = DSM 21790]
MSKTYKILVMVVTCLAVGYLASQFTQENVTTWYTTIKKPSFTPPNWAFPVAWTTLYVFMGVAAGLVWDRLDVMHDTVKKGLTFFAIQLALNGLWSYLFFGLKNPLLGLIEIVLLWLMIYETYAQFTKVSKIAGYLFIPYIAWVSYALVLNGTIWWLNK